MAIINPVQVVEHFSRRLKRKKRNPSLGFLEIRNPKKALEKAHTHLLLIKNFIDSKKDKENGPASFYFVEDNKINESCDFLIRIPGKKGQLDFFVLTEDEEFFDYDLFEKYGEKMGLTYHSRSRFRTNRYYLSELRHDLIEINTVKKIIYIVLISPKISNAAFITLNQLKNAKITYSSSLECIDNEKDEVDRYREWLSRIKNPCPDCGHEWDNNYCYCCGYPQQ